MLVGTALPLPPFQVEPELLHLVRVAVVLVARHTRREVFANGAVVQRLHNVLAQFYTNWP